LQPGLLLEEPLHLVVGQRLAELRAHLLEAGQQRAGLGDPVLDVAAHVPRGVELRLLRQITDAQAVGGKRLAQEVVVDAGHDA
jgi:hypothetical protein